VSLAAGARLGSYEITAKLGEGGMGEVWRARDTKLERDVAIKVLPEAFTEDEERLARFEREAKVLAQLQHPNIASIYGMEESGSTRALVMELVEGPTLADRLAEGGLPLSESLSIARQIAEALEEAHEKGIVHRDLKPQNVKAPIEGKVKVLDFGLAKAMDPAVSSLGGPVTASPTLMNSPTLTAAGTQLGVILGTAAYMAPEQAKGAAVDKRADIWAFGVLIYEMLTGGRLFAGDTVPETLAGVLKTEIDFDALPAETPASIRRLLRRCLERSPKNRLHDIADARIVVEETLRGDAEGELPAAPAAPARGRLAAALLVGAVVGGTVATLVAGRIASSPTDRPAYAFRISEPAEIPLAQPALSPDGRVLVYVANEGDKINRLWVRPLDGLEPRALAGTDGARFPFFSPDGREVAFEAHGDLRRVEVAGGAPRTISRLPGPIFGGSWGADGAILLGNPRGTLLRVSAAAGGTPVEAVQRTEIEGLLTSHVGPAFLPDGRHFVYLADGAMDATGVAHRWMLGSLDGDAPREIAVDPSLRDPHSILLPGRAGHLLFVRGGQLVAQRFDVEAAALVGDPELIASDVEAVGWFHEVPAAISATGTIVYQAGSVGERLDWLNESGETVGTVPDVERPANPRLSRDGRYLAGETQLGENLRAVWVLDIERGIRTQLSERGTNSDSAAFSRDGRLVYFDTKAGDRWQIARQPREGSAAPEHLLKEPLLDLIVQDVSPDGRWLLYSTPAEGDWNFFLLDLEEVPAEPRLWLDADGRVEGGRFSPDGRWLAYATEESGRMEVYVRAVDGASPRRFQISSQGGTEPAWSPDGGRLYFRSPDFWLMASDLEVAGNEILARLARPLFRLPGTLPGLLRSSYDVDSRTGGFLVVYPTGATSSPFVVRTDWAPKGLRP